MNPNPLKPELESRARGSVKPGGRRRLANFLNQHPHLVWAVMIAASLGVFLAVLTNPLRTTLLHRLQTHAFLAIMLVVFSLLALSLLWSKGQRLDAWAFLYFNVRGTRPPWLDGIMLGITQLGNGLAALVIALVLFFVRESRLAYELSLGALTLWLVVELVKSIVHRSRPFVRLTQTRIVGYRERGLSFPSGHTSQAFFLVTLLIQHYSLNFGAVIILYSIAVAVGLTRMYVGAHYPRDVLAGAILGSVWGILVGMVDMPLLLSRG